MILGTRTPSSRVQAPGFLKSYFQKGEDNWVNHCHDLTDFWRGKAEPPGEAGACAGLTGVSWALLHKPRLGRDHTARRTGRCPSQRATRPGPWFFLCTSTQVTFLVCCRPVGVMAPCQDSSRKPKSLRHTALDGRSYCAQSASLLTLPSAVGRWAVPRHVLPRSTERSAVVLSPTTPGDSDRPQTLRPQAQRELTDGTGEAPRSAPEPGRPAFRARRHASQHPARADYGETSHPTFTVTSGTQRQILGDLLRSSIEFLPRR